MISTDPPYYDNIGYADLSDFFYVWLRRSLRTTYPDLFCTMLVPKAAELIATHRFEGSREKAQLFFEKWNASTFKQINTEDICHGLLCSTSKAKTTGKAQLPRDGKNAVCNHSSRICDNRNMADENGTNCCT